MSGITPPPVWIQYATTVIAVLGLLLSFVNLYLQRRDKYPRLKVTQESYSAHYQGAYKQLHSFRVVNVGSVNVRLMDVRIVLSQTYQIRSFSRWLNRFTTTRLLLSRRRETPIPKIEEEGWSDLRDGEVDLPHSVEPGERVRLTVDTEVLNNILETAGFRSFAQYKVAVVDTLNKRHTTYGSSVLKSEEPPA